MCGFQVSHPLVVLRSLPTWSGGQWSGTIPSGTMPERQADGTYRKQVSDHNHAGQYNVHLYYVPATAVGVAV